MNTQRTRLALAIMAIVGTTASGLSTSVSAATLADGYYDMVIHNTPYISRNGYQWGSDGAWNSSFTLGSLPRSAYSIAMYDDDTGAQPINGKYSGTPYDGVQGTIGILVNGGIITGTGKFEFDTILATAGGDFQEYGNSSGFTGSIDGAGNISLTTTGLLATVSDFPALVDKSWNIDNFNGICGTAPCTPSSNTAYDAFSTLSATNSDGTINGAAYDGTRAVLVKGGSLGSEWGGFFGAQYFEVWNVSFVQTVCLPVIGEDDGCSPPPVPIPATAWLFGSGLIGLLGMNKRKRSQHSECANAHKTNMAELHE